jgi:hypothetical protein
MSAESSDIPPEWFALEIALKCMTRTRESFRIALRFTPELEADERFLKGVVDLDSAMMKIQMMLTDARLRSYRS